MAKVVPAAPSTLSIVWPIPVPLPWVTPGMFIPIPTTKFTFSSVVILLTSAFTCAGVVVCRGGQFLANFFDNMIPMRSAGHEQRRVFRKELSQRSAHDVGKLVFGNSIPYGEDETTAWLQDAAGLAVSPELVGKEHDAELASDDVEHLILERQGQSIGLSPRNPILTGLPGCGKIKHGLIEVGRYNPGVRGKPRYDRSCQDAGSRSRLEQVARRGTSGTSRDGRNPFRVVRDF